MPKKCGWILWLTGLPSSGKTTVSRVLWKKLSSLGVKVVILDGDDLRPILTLTPTYSDEGRAVFYSRLAKLAALMAGYETNVIIAATGNRRSHRQVACTDPSLFSEVWIRCSLETCRTRDPKGLYAQATGGSIANMPGVDAGYEPPASPGLVIDSDLNAPEELAQAIISRIPFLSALQSSSEP